MSYIFGCGKCDLKLDRRGYCKECHNTWLFLACSNFATEEVYEKWFNKKNQERESYIRELAVDDWPMDRSCDG